ncbi:Adenylyl cyclase-associated protein [Trichostrongylus colubriformis]|uniref:Adenylyl cyclase-associated protein n=1 Tax=Trichostrongylus colubriformis TaxID=6319 RepID=A0AAN8FEA6_TRICO
MSMDTPRPYSKFPVGYRPMTNGCGPNRTMSSSPSLSLPRTGTDSPFPFQGTSFPQVTAGFNISHPSSSVPVMCSTTDAPGGNSFQWSSPASSERATNRQGSLSETDTQEGRTPLFNRRSSLTMRNSQDSPASSVDQAINDDFLRKIRRHRDEIEESRHQGDGGHNRPNVHESLRVGRRNNSKVAWRNGSVNFHKDSSHSKRSVSCSTLYETQLDPSLIQCFANVRPFSPNSEASFIVPRTVDSVRQHEEFGRPSSYAERRAPMDGFFASRNRREPSWVTNPPPAFAVQGRAGIHETIHCPGSQQFQFPTRSSSVAPLHSDRRRMSDSRENRLTEVSPSLVHDHAATGQHATVGSNGPHQQNDHVCDSNTIGSSNFATIGTEPWHCSSQSDLNANLPVPCSYEYCTESCGRNSSGQALKHCFKATSFPNTSDFSVVPNHAISSNRQFNHESNSPSNWLNGNSPGDFAGKNLMRATRGSFGNNGRSKSRGFRQGPVRSRERSFAIMSRPLTPPAILQTISDNGHPNTHAQYHSIAFNGSVNRQQHKPISVSMPTTSRQNSHSNTNVGLIMAPYGCEGVQGPRTHPHVQETISKEAQHIGLPPAHGILLKNHEGVVRPSKKVVFQCDPVEAHRCVQRGAVPAETPPHVKAYDVALADIIDNWSAVSDQLGGDVKIMREKVTAVFSALRHFLWTAACQVEPSPDEVQKMVSPIVNLLSDINNFKDSRRKAPQFNHLSAVAEGIPAVGWVLVKKTPAAHVKEMLDSSMFYVNRVLTQFKDGDQKNVEWARLWRSLLEAMQAFVRQTHTTGLVWNSAPGCQPPLNDSRPAVSHGATGGPPPPPPPPPPGLLFDDSASSASSADAAKAGRDALFKELNKGEAITAGLRKVTADMQTHKNPALREHSPNVPVGHPHSQPHPPPTTTTTAASQNPPRVELKDGKQWNVEFIVGNPNVVVNVADKKQTVYIYKCVDSVIVVEFPLPEQFKTTFDGKKLVTCVSDIS